ncbi:UrcA family protein [Sphingomonas sp.]|uniref:UrcA family protein n=1 Tax=Sphingomonas sp. TaxID=28214 RepID=UPI003B3A111B
MFRTALVVASFCLTSVGGAALAAHPNAATDGMDVAVEHVSLAGLDLNTAAGQKAGLARLLHASVRVCSREVGLSAYGQCQSDSAARAEDRLSALIHRNQG